MIVTVEEYLEHYGTKRHSGRYPWGSGDDVTQRSRTFLDDVEKLKAQGLTEKQIAEGVGLSTSTELRAHVSIANHAVKAATIAQAEALKAKAYSNGAIAERMGLAGESSVRALLAPGAKDRNDVLFSTSNMLKDEVADKGFIDIGRGVEQDLNITESKLKTAVALLEAEGYTTHLVKYPQLGTGLMTTVKVLAPPGTKYSEVFHNRDKIQQISSFSDDGGRSYDDFQPPLSIKSSRVGIRYAEDGGAEADGVIYVRPGVEDVSIGHSRYSQVRIAVDGTHYLKGMAVYKDDLPAGVDLLFNTNKKDTGNKLDAMKEMNKLEDGSVDPVNPFGASIQSQIFKRDSHGNLIKDADGKAIVSSSMNVIHEQGDWSTWKKELSTQVLSKQNRSLIKTQLDSTYEIKKQGLDEILSLTNPVVRKRLLEGYADALDSSAVHLESAALPRSAWHVILPAPSGSLKETEVYAPNYRDGERVVLIRYPHGGTFEIPELVVNNSSRAAKKMIGEQAPDAIVIHPRVAEKLSGADFDGDHVMVIPNGRGQIKTAPSLLGLKNFDPKASYPKYEGMPEMSSRTKGIQMGSITNLIADMTIKGASQDELARAVRHSMVVIDAEKHELNYKLSAINNGIPALKEKYQGSKQAGSSTLITRAGSETRVPEKRPRRASEGGPIDRATGKKMFEEEPVTFKTRAGEVVTKMRKSTKLAEEEDAFKLSSGTLVEDLYATHSNKLKALANEARKEMVNIDTIPANPSAKQTYAKEIQSLDAKLRMAKRNAPLERQALLIANTMVSAKRESTPSMTKEELKKEQARALKIARKRTGAEKLDIWITDQEWSAIQANAISTNQLNQILDKANMERVRKLATPKPKIVMTPTKKNRAASMLASGYTQAQVADALGVSLSTLKENL